MHMLYTCKKHKNICRKYKKFNTSIKVRILKFFYFFLCESLDIPPWQQRAPSDILTLSMGRYCILTRFALLAALRGTGGSNLIELVYLRLVSGMILADASIALIFGPICNDLPYIELSINFVFKISRAVYDGAYIEFLKGHSEITFRSGLLMFPATRRQKSSKDSFCATAAYRVADLVSSTARIN